MKITAWIAALALTSLLCACSSTPECFKTKRYADAMSLPALQAPAGLTVPKTDDQMAVPNVRPGPVGVFAEAPTGTDAGNPQSRCLTTPPPLTDSSSGQSN